MRHLLLLTFSILVISLTAIAKPVDVKQARKLGSEFLQANTPLKLDDASELHLVTTYLTEQGIPAFYVFNLDHGYVIVSADDCAKTVLAYSEEGQFDPNAVPVQMEDYLQQYVEQIQYGIENHLVAEPSAVEEKSTEALGPMVTAQWGQGCFYNELCPADPDGSCGHTLAGCVAVAMAQIMYYWGYPSKGMGTHSYTPDEYPTQTVDFGSTVYQWDLMQDMFYDFDSLHIDAVARLMWHCGVAVDMDYSIAGSGTYSSLVPNAMKEFFCYSPDLELLDRDDYSSEIWLGKVKACLNLGRPIYYCGAGDVTGHAFVCDGYDANDMLHFNWGWNGSYNGYFADGALDVSDHHYNTNNRAIFNIHPMTTGSSFQVTTNCSPANGGVVLGTGTYNAQEVCSLTAEPGPGYVFQKWERDGKMRSMNSTHLFAVKEDVELTAVFVPVANTQVQAVYYPDATDVQSAETRVSWEVLPSSKPSANTGVKDPEVLFSDDFEGGFTQWTLIDVPGYGESWMAMDLTDFGEGITAHTGAYAVVSNAWYDPFICPDNFMITPEVAGATELSYFVSGDVLTSHHYGVFVSTTGNAFEDFVLVFDETLIVDEEERWVKRQVSLPYGTRYVAFRHYDSYNATFVLIDDVTVSSSMDYHFDVYRTTWDNDGPYSNENTTLLAEDLLAGPFVDEDWDALEPGAYKYGVKLTSASEEVDDIVWSNGLVKGEGSMITTVAVPEQGGTLSGGGFYEAGAACTLVATPSPGYGFVGWHREGVMVSTEATYSFTPSGSGTYMAQFAMQTYEVNVSADPQEGGEVSGGGSYVYGTVVTVQVTPNPNYSFEGWVENGVVVSHETSYTFELTADRSLVALLTFYNAIVESPTASFVTYPNPALAGEEVMLSWPEDLGMMRVELYTAQGVLLRSLELSGDRTSLGNDLVPGLYLLKAVATSGKIYYSKLVIESR